MIIIFHKFFLVFIHGQIKKWGMVVGVPFLGVPSRIAPWRSLGIPCFGRD